MSFSTNVPNASQSPGLFPTQNQTNFTRLQTIISTDHVFNNTADTGTDGIHKKVSMQTRTSVPPSRPAGASAVLYTALDTDTNPQLYYWNGVVVTQLTPLAQTPNTPYRYVSQSSLSGGSSATLYPDPGFLYAGTIFLYYMTTNTYKFYNVIRSGSNDIHVLDSNGSSTPTIDATTFASTNNIVVTNEDSAPQIVVFALNAVKIV